MELVIIGAPGSGKDTLANKLKLEHDYTILSPGEIFRSQAQNKTKLGIYARDKYWGNGLLCPDELTNRLVKDTINNLKSPNIIFNGYPRSIGQAEFLSSTVNITMTIELGIDKDIATERLLRRKRTDDTKDIIDIRFQEHEERIESIASFYRSLSGCSYVFIDADAKPEAIYSEAISYIESNLI